MTVEKALILIDLQIDYFQVGALPVDQAEAVIPVANQLMDCFDLIVATQNWYPAEHGSFAANYLWRKPGQVIDLAGVKQELRTMHAVQNSFGAEFHPDLHTSSISKVFRKGLDPAVDSYSAFYDNDHLTATGLGAWLKEKGVHELYFMGLSTDFCVKFSVLDAIALGFETWLIEDGCRAQNPEDAAAAIAEMAAKGAHITTSGEIKGSKC